MHDEFLVRLTLRPSLEDAVMLCIYETMFSSISSMIDVGNNNNAASQKEVGI